MKPFEEWHKSAWQDYQKLEKEIDKRFEDYYHLMQQNREARRQELEKNTSKDLNVYDHSYIKESRIVETNEFRVQGHSLRFKYMDLSREKDGILIPYVERLIECHPPCAMDLIVQLP